MHNYAIELKECTHYKAVKILSFSNCIARISFYKSTIVIKSRTFNSKSHLRANPQAFHGSDGVQHWFGNNAKSNPQVFTDNASEDNQKICSGYWRMLASFSGLVKCKIVSRATSLYSLMNYVEVYFFSANIRPSPKSPNVCLERPKPIKPSDLQQQESKRKWL